MTPFQRNKQRIEQQMRQQQARDAIENADAKAVTDLTVTPEGFEMLCMNLEQDLVILSGKSLEEKAELKAQRFPVYVEHVNAYIDQGDTFANPILVEMMIWSFDLLMSSHALGNAVQFQQLANTCIEQGQQLPDRFTSKNIATFVADSVMSWAKQQIQLQHSPQPLFNDVFNQLQKWPVPQTVRMKYHKVAGQLASDEGEWEAAYTELTRADMLGTTKHPAKVTTLKGKVIKELEKLGKELPAVSKTNTENTTEGSGTDAATQNESDELASD